MDILIGLATMLAMGFGLRAMAGLDRFLKGHPFQGDDEPRPEPVYPGASAGDEACAPRAETGAASRPFE